MAICPIALVAATSVNRSCLPSADQPLARKLVRSLRAREDPLVAAGAIRRPPEQLGVTRSSRRKDDALSVGRPERAARGRVGRQPAHRRAGEIVNPQIRLGSQSEPRAVGRYPRRRGTSPAGGQAAVRHVPGDPPTRRSAGHCHRPRLGCRRASRWRPPRLLRRPIRSSPRPRSPARALLPPPAVRDRMPRRATSLRRRRQDAPSARSARRCRP